MSKTAPTVFTPLKVGDLELQHRIAMAPLTRCRADDQHVHHDIAAEYYAQRASHPGTLLVTEAVFISERAGGQANVPGIYNAQQIAAWKKIVDAVHAKGSFLVLQLWALGRAASAEQLAKDGGHDVVSASDIPFEGGDKPRALTVEEIKAYVADYAAAAKAFVEEAGGDGVEIHAANGYLIDQFTQTNSNKRTDQYGGSVENRCRFGLEVAEAVTAAVGQKKVGCRLSPFSEFQGMKMGKADTDETFKHFTSELKARFPDAMYLHLIEPRAAGDGDAEAKEGDSLRTLTDVWAPKAVLIAGGHGKDGAERVCRDYENSVAVFGRYFIRNPDLVARVKFGVDFVHYDRDSFYLQGPTQSKGYTEYEAEYGPDGKL